MTGSWTDPATITGMVAAVAGAAAAWISFLVYRKQIGAEKPPITCMVYPHAVWDGWLAVRIASRNPTLSEWKLEEVIVIEPRGAQIVSEKDAARRDAMGGFEANLEVAAKNLALAANFLDVMYPAASTSTGLQRSSVADRLNAHAYIRLPSGGAAKVKLVVVLRSRDARPKTIKEKIVRSL